MPSKGSPSKKLQRQIRAMPEYKEWRDGVLKRDCKNFPMVSKRIQVHHIIGFSQTLRTHNISSIEEARKCEALWDIENGQTLYKGEHSVWTRLCRHKEVSKNLLNNLKQWIKEHKKDDKELK